MKKESLLSFSSLFSLDCKKNISKEKLVTKIYDNKDDIVKNIVDIFQIDEYLSIKYVLSKKGKVTIRVNHLLEYFVKNLVRNNLMIKIDDKNFYMPEDLLLSFKKNLKNHKKKFFENNTKEYNLILGFLDTYGVIEFTNFYDLYTVNYKLNKENALNRLKFITNFYNEIKLITDKKTVYLVNSIIDEKNAYKKYIYDKKEYAIYTNNELRNIHSLEYLKKFKSYKKFNKYLRSTYFIEKNNIKIINKYVLIPFFNYNQLNKEKAMIILDDLLEKYFEQTKKSKKIMIDYIVDVSHDYPRWDLKGYSEREKVC